METHPVRPLRPRAERPWAWAAALLGAWLCAAPALAHPLLDQAQQAFEEAEFERAIEAFSQAEQASDLTRADLVQLYLRRALVHHAMGASAEVDLDLFRLATLEPRYQMPRDIPPAVRDRFAEQSRRVEAPLAVKIEASELRGGVRVRATVTNDLAALVQAVRVGVRRLEDEWRQSDGTSIDVLGAPEDELEVYVEAVGPGGAVVAADGSQREPRRHTIAELLAPPTTGPTPVPGGDEGGFPIWPIVIGGAAAVAAVVILVVLFSGGSDDTQLSLPMPL